LEALDARYFTDASFGRWPLSRQQISDVWERVARGEAAVVSANFLSNFGAQVGERVVLATPSGPLDLVIGGVTAAFEVLAATVLLVTLLGVADTLLAAVIGRTRELGTARAVGIRRRPLVCMVLVEALLLGALGVALATASGVGLAALWVQQTLPCLLGWVLELHLPYRELPVLAALTVTVAGVAAMLPARRAGRLEPGRARRQA